MVSEPVDLRLYNENGELARHEAEKLWRESDAFKAIVDEIGVAEAKKRRYLK